MPQVSVMIAAYNSSATLKCALRSLRNQNFEDYEAWVVGDCCTDDTEQVVAAFGDPRLNWVNLPQHFGSQSGPNNEGLRRARGEYIAYLGHDDLWFPWHLASLVATLEESKASFVHAVVALIDPSGPVRALGAPVVPKVTGGYPFVPPSGWLHRRELVKKCGYWPPPDGQIGGVDFVFQRRAFLAGSRFAGSGQLSVAKFPSIWWRNYALRDGHPQPALLAAMEEDPVGLQSELLAQLVIAYAQRQEDKPLWPSLVAVKAAISGRIKDWYGLDRWPLAQYLAWRQQRGRKRVRPLRGLPPLDGST